MDVQQSLATVGSFFPDAAQGTGPRVVFVGIPYDGGSSYRRGCAAAPDAIREASDSLETYSPRTGRDLAEFSVVDWGCVRFRGWSDLRQRAVDLLEAALRAADLVVVVGGDHTVSLLTVEALARVEPDFRSLILDAHWDLRPSYRGHTVNHATWLFHASRRWPDRFTVLGVRSGLPEEWERAEQWDLHRIRAPFVHVSLDVDVLDPAHFPGVSNPEPGGWTPEQVLEVVALWGRGVRILELVECNPQADPGGRSPVLAAWLLRECILSIL